jgi:hypothetical protein
LHKPGKRSPVTLRETQVLSPPDAIDAESMDISSCFEIQAVFVKTTGHTVYKICTKICSKSALKHEL